jgi:hypothetical protein
MSVNPTNEERYAAALHTIHHIYRDHSPSNVSGRDAVILDDLLDKIYEVVKAELRLDAHEGDCEWVQYGGTCTCEGRAGYPGPYLPR